jgi:phosphoenolpyruvate synthase/pyruvate phosphate dikinase
MHRVIIGIDGTETKVELTKKEIKAMQEQAAEIVIEEKPKQITLEDKVEIILKQFNYERMKNKRDLIKELDAITTNEMKG